MADGLRIGLVKPYSETPVLNVLQDDSDEELSFDLQSIEGLENADVEWLQEMRRVSQQQGNLDTVVCTKLDRSQREMRKMTVQNQELGSSATNHLNHRRNMCVLIWEDSLTAHVELTGAFSNQLTFRRAHA
ncbi:hypothetical protein PF008_g15921 [Phytophthora fragariae]|uniref:Uncharacterized protein n=1 Tax=Phytophthora fragariae TaxID=53985 RepID=A0A6G0RDA6_9STRA|nr:hypothetical protein PF008_g15921 [Phytophthora fragariae]